MARLAIGWFIVVSLTATLGYFLGILTFLSDFEKNGCDMTYMYEYPQFVRIFVKEDVVFEKYGLYAYSEGHLTKRVRDMYFDGVPVLFIPGNAGSYRQVRSFASVALRKSLKLRQSFHFDFFTVDLHEELNGLNGALLNEQMVYVNHTISRILELYDKNRFRRKSIIVIGHSMGGIIARGLLASLPSDSILLPVIITLATPHLRPPAALDFYMADFYKSIEKTVMNKNSTVVSLSGGFNDFLVSPYYTSAKESNFIHVMTTSIPLVWLPIDHLCILWCKQLVVVVTKSIFALVDSNSHKLNLNPIHHQAVFNHFLIENNGIKIHKPSNYQASVDLSNANSKWIERLQKRYTVHLSEGVKDVECHMIRLIDEPDYEYLNILAVNLEVTDWVFACTASHIHNHHHICSNGTHLSHLSKIVPSVHHKRRQLTINMFEFRKKYPSISHIVVRVLPTREQVTLYVDIYKEHDRRIDVKLPQWLSMSKQVLFKETKEKVLHYELVLPQLYHIMQSYKLYVEPVKCIGNHHHAVATLHIPWSNQNTHRYITKFQKKPLDIRLFSSRPSTVNNKSFPSVFLTLDPACTYSISVQSSMLGILGNIARTYTSLLLANIAAVVLLSFRGQLLSIDETGSCSIFFTALKTGVKPYYILTMVKVSSRVLSWRGFSQIFPVSDWQLILEEGNDFFLLPLLLYMCSVGIVWLTSLGLAFSIFVCEASVNKMALRFLSRTVSGIFHISDWVIRVLHKVPFIVAIILIVLSLSACGGVALLFGCVFYFMKLTQMSQEYVEGVVIEYVKYYAKMLFKRSRSTQLTINNSSQRSTTESDENNTEQHNEVRNIQNDESAEQNNRRYPAAHSALFFHFSIMFLWALITGIHIPHVLTWARNFRFSTELKPDPSFLPGLILSLCAIPLWQLDIPKANKSLYVPLSEVLNLIAAATLLYAPLSLYRISYLLTAGIVITTLHQIFAPDRTDVQGTVEDSISDDNIDIKSEVDKMKDKSD